MTDGVNLNGSSTGAAKPARTHYRTEEVREVQARARFLEHEQTPQEQNGLKRLRGLLNQGQPLDQGAPRGYYLNIRV
jgi:hypothetical protein